MLWFALAGIVSQCVAMLLVWPRNLCVPCQQFLPRIVRLTLPRATSAVPRHLVLRGCGYLHGLLCDQYLVIYTPLMVEVYRALR